MYMQISHHFVVAYKVAVDSLMSTYRLALYYFLVLMSGIGYWSISNLVDLLLTICFINQRWSTHFCLLHVVLLKLCQCLCVSHSLSLSLLKGGDKYVLAAEWKDLMDGKRNHNLGHICRKTRWDLSLVTLGVFTACLSQCNTNVLC